MLDYGLSVRRLAQAAGVTERTVRRWKKRGEIPEPYKSVLRVHLAEDSGIASPAWAGWRFREDRLISPEGVTYTQGDIRASPMQREAIRLYRQEVSQRQEECYRARDLRHRVDDVLSALAGLLKAAQHLDQTLSAEPGLPVSTPSQNSVTPYA